MTATTAYRDGSGEVLIEEIQRLNVRVDLLRAEFANLLPCPELPALTAFEPGPTRVAILSYPTPLELTLHIEAFNLSTEAAGHTIESAQLVVPNPDVWAAMIVYRLAAPKDATDVPA
jgi:hypothetical protein